jgi:hypothetical protein
MIKWSALEDLHSLLLINKEVTYRDPWFIREMVGLIHNLHTTDIVETGTYKGDMIKLLSLIINKPIYSCDVIDIEEVKQRFKNYKNIHIEQCKSKNLLVQLQGKLGKLPFFFLDAHTTVEKGQSIEDINPLAEEVKIITELYPKSIICIHDFEVPNMPVFGHGSIDFVTRQKIIINWQVIEKSLKNTRFVAWFPFFPPRSINLVSSWKKLFDLRGRIYIALNPTNVILGVMEILEDFGMFWKFKEGK